MMQSWAIWGVGHEEVGVTNNRAASSPCSPAMNGHELTKYVVAADLERGFFASELQILGLQADRRKRNTRQRSPIVV